MPFIWHSKWFSIKMCQQNSNMVQSQKINYITLQKSHWMQTAKHILSFFAIVLQKPSRRNILLNKLNLIFSLPSLEVVEDGGRDPHEQTRPFNLELNRNRVRMHFGCCYLHAYTHIHNLVLVCQRFISFRFPFDISSCVFDCCCLLL